MFGLFTRRNWKPETLPELSGSYQNLKITLKSLPCLYSDSSGMRKYVYSNFGFDFITGLHEQLGDFELLCQKLKNGVPAQFFVKLSSYSPISVELSGIVNISRRQFDSDLADALIDAFKSVGLRS